VRAATTSPVAWAAETVFYEVFVRSFADSDGDGIGDLDGLRLRLDYLADLGIRGLWLTPVFVAASYHGYDTIDYDHVDPVLGGDEALQRLLLAAHARGIRVLLDLVLNHTSAEHPWFVAARQGDPRWRNWYVWRDAAPVPTWTQPWGTAPTWHPAGDSWYYGLFWSGMPDLDFTQPAVRAELTQVARQWLQRGADGYRLDAVRYLVETGPGAGQADTPPTHQVLQQLAAELTAASPEALLLGEIWTDLETVATYLDRRPHLELHGAFAFDLAGAILADVAAGRAKAFPEVLCRTARAFPPEALDATFLTNHDQDRVLTRLGGSLGQARVAASLLLTLPGVPFVYYGDEIGMRNGRGAGDLAKRAPMQWDSGPNAGFTAGRPWQELEETAPSINVAAQQADPASLLAHYRRLIRLRQALPALARGDYRPLPVTCGAGSCFAFARRAGDELALVVVNLGRSTAAEVELQVADLPVCAGMPLALQPLEASRRTGPPLELAPGRATLRPGPLAAQETLVLAGKLPSCP